MNKRAALTPTETDRIVQLRERRWPVVRIAAALGCSAGSVNWALLKAGCDVNEHRPLKPVPTAPVVEVRGKHVVRRFTEAEDELLLALEASGTNIHRIAVQLGRRHNSIVGRLRTLARRQARAEASLASRP